MSRAASMRAAVAPGALSRAFWGLAEAGEQEIGAWKWLIRKRVLLELKEDKMLRTRARNIPRFKGARNAAEQLVKLPVFQSAACLVIQKGDPLDPVRSFALKKKKQVILPCTGDHPFFKFDSSIISASSLEETCKSPHDDLVKLSQPLKLDSEIKVDLIIVGCVAVDRNTGARLGMGDGTADLEYALLRHMKAVDDSTLVVATVHDKQVVEDIPSEKMEIYDVPVDIICTPTQTIYTKTSSPKPAGIYWNRLSPHKLSHFTVLRSLRRSIEEESQAKVKLAPLGRKLFRVPDSRIQGTTIFIGEISPDVNEAELKTHLKQAGVAATSLSIFRSRNMWTPGALVEVAEGSDLQEQVSSINNSGELKGWRLQASVHREPKKVNRFRALQKMLRSSLAR